MKTKEQIIEKVIHNLTYACIYASSDIKDNDVSKRLCTLIQNEINELLLLKQEPDKEIKPIELRVLEDMLNKPISEKSKEMIRKVLQSGKEFSADLEIELFDIMSILSVKDGHITGTNEVVNKIKELYANQHKEQPEITDEKMFEVWKAGEINGKNNLSAFCKLDIEGSRTDFNKWMMDRNKDTITTRNLKEPDEKLSAREIKPEYREAKKVLDAEFSITAHLLSYPQEIHVLIAMVEYTGQHKEEPLIEVFRWLLGYTDFRGREKGEGAYWWRKELRERLKSININIKQK